MDQNRERWGRVRGTIGSGSGAEPVPSSVTEPSFDDRRCHPHPGALGLVA